MSKQGAINPGSLSKARIEGRAMNIKRWSKVTQDFYLELRCTTSGQWLLFFFVEGCFVFVFAFVFVFLEDISLIQI